jgi:hypothetical protein
MESNGVCGGGGGGYWCDGGGGDGGGGGGARGGGAGGDGGGGAGVSDTQQPAQFSHDRTFSSHSQSPVVEAGSAVHAAASCDQWEQVTPPQVVQDIAVEQERNRRRESSDFGVSSARDDFEIV